MRARTSLLVFTVLFVHSLPEGLALGTAWASDHRGPGRVHRDRDRGPEHPRGDQRRDPDGGRRVTGRPGSSGPRSQPALPQPIAAPIAFLLVEQVESLLPVSFAFAAGAMLALVAVEVFPDALRGNAGGALAGGALGAAGMLVLSVALGV